MPYWKLFYHVVWSTKHRLPLIEPAWEEELYGYMWGKATALECIPHAINGTADHTHVVISVPPRLPVATVIGQIKGVSSYRANELFVANKAFSWQTEYGLFSFSERSLPSVVEYVNNQKKHHAENSVNSVMEDCGSAE